MPAEGTLLGTLLLRCYGVGPRVQDLGLRAQDPGSGFRFRGLGFRVLGWGQGFRV